METIIKIAFIKNLFEKAQKRNKNKLDYDSFRIGIMDFWEYRKQQKTK